MFFGVLIIAVVYLPILALTGIEGKMFHPMALTVMLALGGALVLSLTLMPALCAWLLRGKISEDDNVIIRCAKNLYAPTLHVALRLRGLVVTAAIALFAGSLWVFTHLGAEFVPKLDEGSITAMLYKPVGMSMEESLRTDIEVENRLRAEFPELVRIFSRIGTSAIASDPMPPNESDVYLFYKPLAEWPKTAGRPTTKAELLVGDDGKPIKMGAQSTGGLEPLALIVFEGIVAEIDDKGTFIVNAKKIFVEKADKKSPAK